jgi:excinuclease UvrABC nuclease subunit
VKQPPINYYRHFKSVKKVKEATLEELVKVLGNAKGELVHNYYNK